MVALGQFVAASSVTATIVSILFPSDVPVLESIMSTRGWMGLLSGVFYLLQASSPSGIR
jgi:hypothetical protein